MMAWRSDAISPERKLMDCLSRLGYDIEIKISQPPNLSGI